MDHNEDQRTDLPNVDSNEDSTGTLVEAWSLLREQQEEFHRRNAQLEQLRSKLARHLARQHELLALHEKELQGSQTPDYTHNDQPLSADIVEQQVDLVGNPQPVLTDVDAIAAQYQARIAELVDEKNQAERRISELQHQLDTWQTETQTAVRSHKMGGVLISSDWRLAFSLICGLLIGGLLSIFMPANYQLTMSLELEPEVVAAKDLHKYRDVWSKTLSFAAAEAVDYAFTVKQVASSEESLALIASCGTSSLTATKQQLRDVAKVFENQLLADRQASIDDIEKQQDQRAQRVVELRNEYDHVLNKLADERLVIDVENPRQELNRLYTGIAESRARLDAIDTQKNKLNSVVQELQMERIPELPAVPERTRKEAEQTDSYLMQDREALRVRLNQLRDHILSVFTDCQHPMKALDTETRSLSVMMDDLAMKIDDPAAVSTLEELSTTAADLQQIVIEFQSQWSRDYETISGLRANPGQTTMLELQEDIEYHIKDFTDNLSAALTKLQADYQKLSSSLANPAQHFQIMTDVVQQVRAVLREQLNLARTAKRALPKSDFQLDSIVHSAVGLTRRVRTRQKEIEARLSLDLRNELISKQEGKIRDQQLQLAELAKQRNDVLQSILNLQDELNRLIPYIEEHGVTDELVIYTPEQADQLLVEVQRLKDLSEQEQERLSQIKMLPSPVRANAASFTHAQAEMSERLSQVGFAGVISIVLCYILLSVVSKWFAKPQVSLVQSDRSTIA